MAALVDYNGNLLMYYIVWSRSMLVIYCIIYNTGDVSYFYLAIRDIIQFYINLDKCMTKLQYIIRSTNS